MSVLNLNNVTMRFGGVTAVNNLNLNIEKGEIVALIGPNGAGKTTAFNLITGVYTPTEGKIGFLNADITGKLPSNIAKLGIGRTFQNIRLFKDLSVYENVIIAQHLHIKSNFVSAVLRLPGYMKEEKKMREKTDFLLEKLELSEYKNYKSSSLPYGKQRRLEIARALATDPKLLLLDEPVAGMNPQETMELGEFIGQIKEEFDLTVLLIEHHMDMVMEISDRIYVLDFGNKIAEGTPMEIQNNQRVIAAYLGGETIA